MLRTCSLRVGLKTRLDPEPSHLHINKLPRLFVTIPDIRVLFNQSMLIVLDCAVPVLGIAVVWDIWSITLHIG
jgi:hypothetical protein